MKRIVENSIKKIKEYSVIITVAVYIVLVLIRMSLSQIINIMNIFHDVRVRTKYQDATKKIEIIVQSLITQSKILYLLQKHYFIISKLMIYNNIITHLRFILGQFFKWNINCVLGVDCLATKQFKYDSKFLGLFVITYLFITLLLASGQFCRNFHCFRCKKEQIIF